MKKIIPIILAAVLLLTACGSAATQTAETTETVEQTSELPDANLTEIEEQNASEDKDSDSDSAAFEKAKAYIDRDLSELVAEFGEPESAEYAHSCLGTGEDGMLVYSDFVVYTYREDGQETVTDVDTD